MNCICLTLLPPSSVLFSCHLFSHKSCQSLRKRLQAKWAEWGRRGLRQLSGRGLSLRKTSFVQMVSWRRRRHQVACPGLGSRQLQRNNSYCCQLNRSSVDICVCHIMRQSREGGQEMSSANLRPKTMQKKINKLVNPLRD